MPEETQPTQLSSSPATKGTIHLPSVAGGGGIIAIVMMLLNGHTDLLEKLVIGWAPPLVLLGVFMGAVFVLADKWVPGLVGALSSQAVAQTRQAESMEKLGDAIHNSIAERKQYEESIDLSLRTMITHMERMGKKLDSFTGAK